MTLQIPSHVRHWHGASANHTMSHIAIAESLNGSSTTWMEEVDEKPYRARK